MFERYEEKARRVIFFARYEASHSGSPYIETEHLLLGVLREDKPLAERFLGSHAAVDSIRKQIQECTLVREKISTSVDLPLSGECKRVLAYAAEEAERLDNPRISTEHLLLGLLREEKGQASRILHEHGLSVASVRDELRNDELRTDRPRTDDAWPPENARRQRRFPPMLALTAHDPKLVTADPLNSTGFHEDPGPHRQDPGTTRPPGRMVTCLNMTMAQFAESLPRIAPGYLRNGMVIDATGLDGAWDFTLNFSPAGMSDGVSLFEAIEDQLGLKLEATAQPRPQEIPFWFAEVLIRAVRLARRSAASEIGTGILLEAMNSSKHTPSPSALSDIESLLAALDGIPGSDDGSAPIGLSSEVRDIIGKTGGYGQLWQALRSAQNPGPNTSASE